MRKPRLPILLAAIVCLASPARGEVVELTDTGFVSHHEALVAATPDELWAHLIEPSGWWSESHTWSGDAANLSLRPGVGGCFCETIPSGSGAAGEVEHMRVVYVARPVLLRLSGALGPLQSEAVTGVLTVTLEPEDGYTRIAWDYVVGGYMRSPMREIAPAVDRVVGEQLLRLAARLGAKVDPAPRRP